MGKPIVIAFLGRAGSGKSTAANYIEATYGARRVSFAGPLKELTKDLFEFTDDQVYGTQEVKETVDPRYGFTPRQAMQRLGNGSRVHIGSQVWVDGCLNAISNLAAETPGQLICVIDDARYVNEAEAITTDARIDGHVIKLTCPDAQTAADPNHPSEAQVDLVPDIYIETTIVSKMSPGSTDLVDKVCDAVANILYPTDGTEGY